jgi:hypothetical protein
MASALQRKPSKPASLPTAFTLAAARDPEGALSHLMLAAFGVSLAMLMSLADRIMTAKDVPIILLAMTAGVQIRNHVVFVGRDYANVRVRYPELVIEGDREQRDIFNFGALHALGHVFAHVTTHDLGQKIISKAGSCITGERATESEAGKINKEFVASWTTEDKASWVTWVPMAQAAHRSNLDPIVASIPTRARAFAAALSGGTAAAPGAPPRPAAAAAGGAAPAPMS